MAIDGPAGVGKSSVGLLVARRLGCRFINTGEMYRALTWKALQLGLDLDDGAALAKLARDLRWEFRPAAGGTALRTRIGGEAVTSRIRDERVSRHSSRVAGFPGVRRRLRALQRALARRGGIVMEGRDITTVVLPGADVKVYLDASVRARALRRWRQLRAAGLRVPLREIQADILARDRNDSRRRINPLRKAPGAMVLDSTRLSLREAAERILERVRRLLAERAGRRPVR